MSYHFDEFLDPVIRVEMPQGHFQLTRSEVFVIGEIADEDLRHMIGHIDPWTERIESFVGVEPEEPEDSEYDTTEDFDDRCENPYPNGVKGWYAVIDTRHRWGPWTYFLDPEKLSASLREHGGSIEDTIRALFPHPDEDHFED